MFQYFKHKRIQILLSAAKSWVLEDYSMLVTGEKRLQKSPNSFLDISQLHLPLVHTFIIMFMYYVLL